MIGGTPRQTGIVQLAKCLIPKPTRALSLFPGRQIAKYEKCPRIDHFLYSKKIAEENFVILLENKHFVVLISPFVYTQYTVQFVNRNFSE